VQVLNEAPPGDHQVADYISLRRDYLSCSFAPGGDPEDTSQHPAIGALHGLLGEGRWGRPPKSLRTYAVAYTWERPGYNDVHLAMAPKMRPCLAVAGGFADELYRYVRGNWLLSGMARLARTDVALDVNDDCAFDVLQASLVTYARTHGYSTDLRGDWADVGSPKGRTLYVGSRSSVYMLRLYEFRKHHGFGAHCRCEVEFKPQSKDKHAAFMRSSPEVYAGFAPAVHVAQVLQIPSLWDLRAYSYGTKRSDLDRRIDMMLSQYGRTWDDLLALHGGDALHVVSNRLAELRALAEAAKKNRAAASAEGASPSDYREALVTEPSTVYAAPK